VVVFAVVVVGVGVVLPDPKRLEKKPPDFWVVVSDAAAGAGVGAFLTSVGATDCTHLANL
jgi:hypothetical protein